MQSIFKAWELAAMAAKYWATVIKLNRNAETDNALIFGVQQFFFVSGCARFAALDMTAPKTAPRLSWGPISKPADTSVVGAAVSAFKVVGSSAQATGVAAAMVKGLQNASAKCPCDKVLANSAGSAVSS
jgi:hypothetical protein